MKKHKNVLKKSHVIKLSCVSCDANKNIKTYIYFILFLMEGFWRGKKYTSSILILRVIYAECVWLATKNSLWLTVPTA